MPDRAAVATARLEGAPTAAITGIRATSAFCTSSKLARPLTNRSDALIGRRRSKSAAPTSLKQELKREFCSRFVHENSGGHLQADFLDEVVECLTDGKVELIQRAGAGHGEQAITGKGVDHASD